MTDSSKRFTYCLLGTSLIIGTIAVFFGVFEPQETWITFDTNIQLTEYTNSGLMANSTHNYSLSEMFDVYKKAKLHVICDRGHCV